MTRPIHPTALTDPLSGAGKTSRPPRLGRALAAALLSLAITAGAMLVVLRSSATRPSASDLHLAQRVPSAPVHRPQRASVSRRGNLQPDSWPAGTAAWTVQVGSFRQLGNARPALALLEAHGASDVDSGILRSDRHPGLVPGYWVVYTGVLPTHDAAAAATGLAAARAAGFSDAFPRHVLPAVP